MYTFTGCLFSERIFPFFSPGVCDGGRNTAPLVITDVSPEPQTGAVHHSVHGLILQAKHHLKIKF